MTIICVFCKKVFENGSLIAVEEIPKGVTINSVCDDCLAREKAKQIEKLENTQEVYIDI